MPSYQCVSAAVVLVLKVSGSLNFQVVKRSFIFVSGIHEINTRLQPVVCNSLSYVYVCDIVLMNYHLLNILSNIW